MAGFFAALAGVLGFAVSRTEKAQDKRAETIKAIAEKVLEEANVAIRLNTLEVVLPRVEQKIDDTAAVVKDTNETLNRLLMSGRLHIKREEGGD